MSAVEVLRGGLVESRHAVSVAVSDHLGSLAWCAGDPQGVTFMRSAAKPLQALPLVEEGLVERFGFTEEELALCCASHEGEPAHVEGVRSVLAKTGVDESLLRCGPHAPFSKRAARALHDRGESPQRVHNNCSGKHAGMLALAVGSGWDPVDYHRIGHPVQRRMLAEAARWSGVAVEEIGVAVDGCGVACFAMPLTSMAAAFARFSRAAGDGEPARLVVDAMTRHPSMVGGTGRTCTDVMARAGGRTFVKVGAEGVYCGGIPERGLGFAIKAWDGGRRAAEVALIEVLRQLDVFGDADVDALCTHARPEVRNTLGEVVGEVRAAFELVSVARREG